MAETKKGNDKKKAATSSTAIRVLAVNDDSHTLTAISEALEAASFEVIVATDAQRALSVVLKRRPHLLILDASLRGAPGADLYRWVQASDREEFIPVLFLTQSEEEENQVREEEEINVADFIRKPVDPADLVMRIQNAARLKVAEQKSRDQVTIDKTTGLFNRRFLTRRLEEELGRARRHKISLACARIGIDHFASLELTHGKEFAEYLLASIATLVKSNTRREDTLARLDERELVAILTNYNAESSWVYAERIRKSIEVHSLEVHGQQLKITLSVGIAVYTQERPDETADSLLTRAGEALQQAQDIGRNDIVVSVNLGSGESILCW